MRGRADVEGELRAILTEREPLYSKAEWVVDTDAMDVGGVVDLLADREAQLFDGTRLVSHERFDTLAADVARDRGLAESAAARWTPWWKRSASCRSRVSKR